MLRILAVTVSVCVANVCSAADFDPYQGPKPIAVLVHASPWKAVLGSDTPRVVIYENGDVIFAKYPDDRLVYYHVALDNDHLEKLREQLKPVFGLKKLDPMYDLMPGWSDLPEVKLFFRDGERAITTSIYGLVNFARKQPAYTEPTDVPKEGLVPNEVLKVHKWLCELDYPNSKEWTPRYVEVMLWDYSYAPEASIQWPKDWPSLNSNRAIKRGEDFSIFLDGTLHPKLDKFLATRQEKGAVEIEAKKMAAASRFTFPGEPIWRKAFADAMERARDHEAK